MKLRSVTDALDTETPKGRLMFNVLGTIAEHFLDLNRERTLEGLKAAAARGRKGGRRRKLPEEDLALPRALLKDPSIPMAQVARRLGARQPTFYADVAGPRTRSLDGAGPWRNRSSLTFWTGWPHSPYPPPRKPAVEAISPVTSSTAVRLTRVGPSCNMSRSESQALTTSLFGE